MQQRSLVTLYVSSYVVCLLTLKATLLTLYIKNINRSIYVLHSIL